MCAARDKPDVIAIGAAWSRGGLRLFDQPDDAGIGGVGSGCGGGQVQWRAGIRHSTADVLTDSLLEGQRLASQRGLVEDTRCRQPPIDRHHLSGRDDKAVTDDDVINGYLAELAADPLARSARAALQQQPEITARAALGTGLEQPAARQHHGDDRTANGSRTASDRPAPARQ